MIAKKKLALTRWLWPRETY